MAESYSCTLESLIDKATDPTRSSDGVDYHAPVWDRVNREMDGPAIALRYIVEKVKRRDERVALSGLALIETCVQNCGRKFHQEVGKYRFLNELIKLLSTKYEGNYTAEVVKKKIIELMFMWSKGLPNEIKVAEAYKMLKQQGVVLEDPVDPYIEAKPSPNPKQDGIFNDEEKSKLLARLLKSKHPEDLQAANRLIKTVVRQDELKVERIARRNLELDTCSNNVKLLTEMLTHYSKDTSQTEKDLMKELYDSCEKLRPQLFKLASQATEENDEGLADILRGNDELARVLEDYRRIIGKPDSSTSPPSPPPAAAPTTGPTSMPATTGGARDGSSSLIDLGLANQNPASPPQSTGSSVLDDQLRELGLHDTAPPATATQQQVQPQVNNLHNLSPWGGAPMPPATNQVASGIGVVRPMGTYPITTGMAPNPVMRPGMPLVTSPAGGMVSNMGGFMRPQGVMPVGGVSSVAAFPRPAAVPASLGTSSPTLSMTGSVARGSVEANNRKSPATSLDVLGQEVLQTQKQQQKQKQEVAPIVQNNTPTPVPEGSLLSLDEPVEAKQPTPILPPPPQGVSTPPTPQTASLDDLFVPLDSVLPGNAAPLTILDKNGIRTIFHFAKVNAPCTVKSVTAIVDWYRIDRPEPFVADILTVCTSAELPRTDTLIIVVTTMSTLSTPVKNFIFQAAVPKTMKVKLQPPSASELPAHNPILPPSAITQVMLLANPSKDKTRLKYRICYETDGATMSQTGDVDSFPDCS